MPIGRPPHRVSTKAPDLGRERSWQLSYGTPWPSWRTRREQRREKLCSPNGSIFSPAPRRRFLRESGCEAEGSTPAGFSPRLWKSRIERCLSNRVLLGKSLESGGLANTSDAGSSTTFRTSITATLSVRNGASAVDFYKAAFNATELYRVDNGAGSIVAQLSVSGAEFWVADESPEHLNFSPESLGGCSVRMLLIVEDPDAVCKQAVAAGATQVSPVGEGHGWRLGRILDPFGHHWEIGRQLV